jgi:hypothetical protein
MVATGISLNHMQKTSIQNQLVIVTVPPATITRSSEEVEQTLGVSPGPEFLMGLAVEHEDPFELSSTFLGTIIEALHEPATATAVAH